MRNESFSFGLEWLTLKTRASGIKGLCVCLSVCFHWNARSPLKWSEELATGRRANPNDLKRMVKKKMSGQADRTPPRYCALCVYTVGLTTLMSVTMIGCVIILTWRNDSRVRTECVICPLELNVFLFIKTLLACLFLQISPPVPERLAFHWCGFFWGMEIPSVVFLFEYPYSVASVRNFLRAFLPSWLFLSERC